MKNRRVKTKIIKSLDEKWEDRQRKKLKHCTCGHATFSVDKKCKQHLNLHDFFQKYKKRKTKSL
jgi:hypothetical protein